MKKITGIMLAVVMLVSVLSVSAFAVNAPLTAAEFFAARNVVEDASTGGTISFSKADPVLPNAYDTEITEAEYEVSLWTLANGNFAEEIDVSNNEFDVLVMFTEPVLYSGYRLALFYNPEIVRPVQLYNATVYDVSVIDGYDPAEKPKDISLGKIGEDFLKDLGGNSFTAMNQMTDSSADYTKYLNGEASAYASWETQLIDGMTTMVAANATDIEYTSRKKYELARWPFEFVAADNNWYRTKIVGSYDQFANATTAIAPVIANNGVMYIENTAYTGPKFDIVGAMEAGEGKLRFGSVYFKDGGVHDNETVIVDAGVVLYPSEFLDGESLTLDTEGAVIISAAGYYADGTDDDQVVYTGVLTGLTGNEKMYITARSFVKYMDGANEVVVYSDPIARNLNNVDGASMK